MKITGYHIDPTTQTITQVEVDQHSLDDIYRIIHARTFDLVRLNREGDAVYVDDEGLLNGAANTHGMFILKGDDFRRSVPLAGHGLVLGCDLHSGDSRNAQIPLDDLQHMVEFVTVDEVRKRARAGDFD